MKPLFAVPFLLATCGLDVSPTEGTTGGGPGGGGPPQATIFYAFDIQPLFQSDCIHCHGGAGGLNLESHAGTLTGGVSGRSVIPFDPEGSLLLRRLDGSLPPTMPLDGPPFTGPEVDRIRQWILEGALDN